MKQMIEAQRAYFKAEHTLSYAARKRALEALYRAIESNENSILDALNKDLNKSRFEAYSTEVGFVLKSISITLKHLKQWMKRKKVKTPFYQGFSKSYVMREPKGTVLIIGPYNYPFQLSIEPLIGALAAGNTVVLKPSEFTKHTERVIHDMLDKAFDQQLVTVVRGGPDTTKELLDHRFDHIFFTGSARVGKIVYQAAAKHLTPVTLELGGKSPAIVDKTAKLDVAAKRIAFGKFLNAGQTCIAPDYILVENSVKDAFMKELTTTLERFYAFEKDHYPTIVNDKHFERIKNLIDPQKVAHGGKTDEKSRTIEPTVMERVTFDDRVMQEEIFGPVLPVLTFENFEALIEELKNKDAPLALYMFSESKPDIDRVFRTLRFGGGAINDTVMHVANHHLPFGGVGESGFGRYHGKHSFDTFSNPKAYMKKSTKVDPPLTYPPYEKREKLVRKILK